VKVRLSLHVGDEGRRCTLCNEAADLAIAIDPIESRYQGRAYWPICTGCFDQLKHAAPSASGK